MYASVERSISFDISVTSRGQPVGYARLSSADQSVARQIEALGGVDRLFGVKVSGKNIDDRPQLLEMLAYVRDGDTIRVKSPDRFARSTKDLLELVDQLRGRGLSVEFVDNQALNTSTPQGEFMLTILAAVTQLERSVTREPG